MISLPPGFDAAALVGELFSLAAPFAGIALLIAAGLLLHRLLSGFRP